jgi:hypothetical protein
MNKNMYKSVKYSLIVAFLVVASISCKKDEKKVIDKDFFCKAAPKGWTCEFVEVEKKFLYLPQVDFGPLFVVRYELPDSTFSYDNKLHKPELYINVYPIEEREIIQFAINDQQPVSSCVALSFGQNEPYYITTSPCFINDGIVTNRSRTLILPLFEKFKKELANFNSALLSN